MGISAIGPSHTAPASHEQTEGPGPDHDGDSDDSGAVQSQAATAPGTGGVVDKTA